MTFSLPLLVGLASAELTQWTTVLERAPWRPRALPAGDVYNGTFYLLGGANGLHMHFESDMWGSEDGARWERVSRRVPFGGRGYYDAVFLRNGTMVAMGGLNIRKTYSDVWTSHDFGKSWSKIAENAPWGVNEAGKQVGRGGYHTLVLEDDSILMFGGSYGSFTRNFFGDVWISRDAGRTWQQQYDPSSQAASWGSRSGMSLVPLNGSIFLMGGDSDDYAHGINKRYDDVWRSDDLGASWEFVTNAPWGNRTGLQCVALDDRCMHCIGGQGNPECNQGKATLFADTWTSCDGAKTWKRVSNSGFGCDGSMECNNCGADDMLLRVKDSKVWMFGADREKALPWPMSNSVWTLEEPDLSVLV